MSTYGQFINEEIERALQNLDQYMINGYEVSEINNLLLKIASAMELFLKRDAFPEKNNRETFYKFIEELKEHSLDQKYVEHIHAIRVAYNDAKHDPNYSISIIQLKKLLENLKLVINEILLADLGRVNTPICMPTKRVFWICAWDHYSGGATEVTIFLPCEYDGYLGAHSLDHVHIYIMQWDDFKADLPNYGKVHSHETLIPKGQVEFWLSQGDCLMPFVFEGEYNSLIICLSKYLKDVDVFSGLAREDDPVNLLQTAVMAAIDVYANNPNEKKESQYISALLLVNNQYAVLPKFNDRIKHFIDSVIGVIDQAPLFVKSNLSGPIWITKEAYDLDESTNRNDAIRMLIDSKNRIVLGVRKL